MQQFTQNVAFFIVRGPVQQHYAASADRAASKKDMIFTMPFFDPYDIPLTVLYLYSISA